MASAVITVTQSWNRYSYAANNPMRYNDPSGELPMRVLSAEQRRVFENYAAQFMSQRDGCLEVCEDITAQDVWNSLSESQQTTFYAVTHALENTRLTDENGNPLLGADGNQLNALNLVESLTQTSGILMTTDKNGNVKQDKDGRKQFRLLVTLKKGAISTLDKSKQFFKSTNSHVYKDGEVMSGAGTLRQDGGPPSLQVSYLADGVTADIDVDYRSRGNFFAHNDPCNSDVACGSNVQRHNKMFGKENPLENIPQQRTRQ